MRELKRWLVLSLFVTGLFGSADSVFACLDSVTCQSRFDASNAPSCCCNNFWSAATQGYANLDACLCGNGVTSYCPSTPAPPVSCATAGAGWGDDPGAACPGDSRCTGVALGGKPCMCPAGQWWDGDACETSAAPAGNCSTAPTATNLDWDAHLCGNAGCAPSQIFTQTQPGTSVDQLANPMIACCGTGWGENTLSGSKLDCVEDYAQAAQTFKDFYLHNAAADNVKTAGIANSNQVFLLDKSGVPLNGFYDQNGNRCRFVDTGGTIVNPTQPIQMTVYLNSLNALQVPVAAGILPGVPQYCCYMVLFAIERKCPNTTDYGVPSVRLEADTPGPDSVRRCAAAKWMKLDFAIYDLCDSADTHRTRFRVATSVSTEDPAKASVYPNQVLDIQQMVRQFYPPLFPDAVPACPATPTLTAVPWTSGMCRLTGGEAFYP